MKPEIKRMHDIQTLFRTHPAMNKVMYPELYEVQHNVHYNTTRILPYLAKTVDFRLFAKEYDIDLSQPVFAPPSDDHEFATKQPYALLDRVFAYDNKNGVYTWCLRNPQTAKPTPLPTDKPKDRITVKETTPKPVAEKVTEVKPEAVTENDSPAESIHLVKPTTKPKLTLWERFLSWMTA